MSEIRNGEWEFVGDRGLALAQLRAEVARLRAENEALKRSWDLDCEYRDILLAALMAVRTEAMVLPALGGWHLTNATFEKVRAAIEGDDLSGASDEQEAQ